MTSFGYRLNPRYAIKECLSCGALYTEDFCCSKGNVEEKILVPKLFKNYTRCARCGHPVDGLYCQGCALLRKKLKEDLVTYFQDFQNTSESSNDNTNIVNAPREPFVVKQVHGVNPPHIDKCRCECGDVLDGIFCQQSTLPCVSKPNFVNESSNIFNPPPQPPIYSCEFCGSNAQYGHYCTPQVPFINPETGYSQDFNFPQDIHDFQQQYLCCDQCGGPHKTFQCQRVIFFEPCCENCGGPYENFQCQPLNYYEPNPSYDSNYSDFDQFGDFHPQQYLCCENYEGPHKTFHCQPLQYTVDYPIFNAYNDLLNSQNEISIAQNKLMEQMTQLTSMCELACQTIQKKQEEKRIEEEQAANARYWKILACCDDDDDYNFAITPVLSTEEPDNSLSMGNEHLDTILATESDKVIKSSIKNLVLIPSESEGIPDTMCDVHLVNNPTPLEAKDHFESVINSNDDISSSDDVSLYNENIEYVEASPHDSEVVSLEVAEIVISKEEEIEDDNMQISSGSTTTHSYISLSEYDSFIFDLSNDQFPPTDRSDFTHEEFADELTHILYPPEYDYFYFRNFPDPGEWISSLNFGIRENLSSTTCVNLPAEDDHSPLLAYVVWIFLAYITYPVIPPYLHSFGNEDTIFDPDITINCFYSFKPGLSHRCGTFKFNTHRSHLNESSMEMLFSTCFPMDQ
nr:hypothetical protein [Tanacetum cinerariifolium]